MAQHWSSILGRFDFADTVLYFRGGVYPASPEQRDGAGGLEPTPRAGYAIVDERFAGGSLSAIVTFKEVSSLTGCELILYYDPASGFIVNAGLGGGSGMYSIRHFDGKQWVYHRLEGLRANLAAGKPYSIRATTTGSRVTVNVDGVDVIAADLPYILPPSQVGVWCASFDDVQVGDFRVDAQRPKAFVVMEFSAPYNDVYADVIRTICQEFRIDVVRADEEYGPGVIVADIAKQIKEATFVLADITPANPNVFYEVGFAHALNKPTILLAERGTKLPFDVSPFRTLFYENSITGKARLEEGLRKHLRAVLTERPLT